MQQSCEKNFQSSSSETRSSDGIVPTSLEGVECSGAARQTSLPAAVGCTAQHDSHQKMSAHSLSHCRADDRLNRLRYSWEQEETPLLETVSSLQLRPIETKHAPHLLIKTNSLDLTKDGLKTSNNVLRRGYSVEQETNATDRRPHRSAADIYRKWTRRPFRKGRMQMHDSEAAGKNSSSLKIKSTKKCTRRVLNELEKQKHVLRQCAGRRLMHMNPPEVKGQTNPGHPTILDGKAGQERGGCTRHHSKADEHETQETIKLLKSYLEKLRLSRQRKEEGITLNRLYRKPATKRVFVYGESDSLGCCPQSIKADSMLDLLSTATAKMRLSRPARYLHALNGRQLNSFEEIDADQVICVSSSKPGQMGGFFSSLDDRQVTHVRANWIRARKIYGPSVTDIVVVKSTQARTDIGVDAFGPSVYSSKTRTD